MERETPNGQKPYRDERNFQRRRWVNYHTLREELFSVFVDNIPVGKGVDWLRALFSKDGQAVDVFIPARGRRVSNSRFGFVRYKSLGEARAAIRRWSGAIVGKAKLVVLLADNGGKPRSGFRFVGEDQQGAMKSCGEVRVVHHFQEGDKFNASQEGQIRTKRRVKFEAFLEQEDWLRLILMADLRDAKLCESIEDEMRKEEISFVKLIPAGGRKVMIHFACEEDLKKCLVADYRSILKNFIILKRWCEEDVPRSRSVWISLLGLPFRAWTERNLERLAAPYGILLKMDDRDVRFVGVGRARMLIETTRIDRICESVEAELEGKVFVINLCEDCCLGGCELDVPLSVEEEGNSVSPVAVGGHSSGRERGMIPVGHLLRRTSSSSPVKSSVGRAAPPSKARQEVARAGGSRSFGKDCEGDSSGSLSRAEQGAGGALVVGQEVVESSAGLEEECLIVDSDRSAGDAEIRISSSACREFPGAVPISESSWVSLFHSNSVKSARFDGEGEKDSKEATQKKRCDAGDPCSSLIAREVRAAEKILRKKKFDKLDQEESLCFSDKFMSSLKRVRRKSAKVKKDIRYLRRKKVRPLGIDQEPGAGFISLSQHIEEMQVVEEEERSSSIRRETEDSLFQPRETELEAEQPHLGSCGAIEGLQEERSSDHFDKTLSAFKLLKRRESKAKKTSKGQRSLSKEKLEGLKNSYVEVLVSSKASRRSKSVDKETDEERRALKQRKEAEETLLVAEKVGMKFLGTKEEGIQFFINQDKERRREKEEEKKARDRYRRA